MLEISKSKFLNLLRKHNLLTILYLSVKRKLVHFVSKSVDSMLQFHLNTLLLVPKKSLKRSQNFNVFFFASKLNAIKKNLTNSLNFKFVLLIVWTYVKNFEIERSNDWYVLNVASFRVTINSSFLIWAVLFCCCVFVKFLCFIFIWFSILVLPLSKFWKQFDIFKRKILHKLSWNFL